MDKTGTKRLCLNMEVEDDEVGDLGEPANYKTAMLDPDKVIWQGAMDEEMKYLKGKRLNMKKVPDAFAVGSIMFAAQGHGCGVCSKLGLSHINSIQDKLHWVVVNGGASRLGRAKKQTTIEMIERNLSTCLQSEALYGSIVTILLQSYFANELGVLKGARHFLRWDINIGKVNVHANELDFRLASSFWGLVFWLKDVFGVFGPPMETDALLLGKTLNLNGCMCGANITDYGVVALLLEDVAVKFEKKNQKIQMKSKRQRDKAAVRFTSV
ncbi:hypothetical protein Tco_0677531 [Tanacetum coccineum]|uniref:Uncharacterized protein n=1 Tax=Tanacetum coccineum TaxID=301880 RepID=A0ABQ4XDT4_9ASTR